MKRAMESDGENHWSSRSDGEAYGWRDSGAIWGGSVSLFSQLLFDITALISQDHLGILGVVIDVITESCILDLISI